MGLDMTLTKRRYVRNWEHMKPEQLHTVTVKQGGKVVKEVSQPYEVVYLVCEWRKANAIHNWFVNNTQGGDDDNGQDTYVSHEQLMELLDLCKIVKATAKLKKGKIQNGQRSTEHGWEPIMQDGQYIENAEAVAELLPTQGGFFFGSTDYDENYMYDIDQTIEALSKIKHDKDSSYYYCSSW